MALGAREKVTDVARNLERWVAAVVIRTFHQDRLQAFATAAPKLHVINALTDDGASLPGDGGHLSRCRKSGARSPAARSPTSATATTSPLRWSTRRC